MPGRTHTVSPSAAFATAWLIERHGRFDEPQLPLSIPLLATKSARPPSAARAGPAEQASSIISAILRSRAARRTRVQDVFMANPSSGEGTERSNSRARGGATRTIQGRRPIRRRRVRASLQVGEIDLV